MPLLDRKGLLDILDSKLSAEDVATLVFDLGLDPANLEGTIKRARLRSLVDYYERRGQMDYFIAAVNALRPDALAPDTVYGAPRLEPPGLRWPFPRWRRGITISLLITVVLAVGLGSIQWYQSRAGENSPTIASLTRRIEQEPDNPDAYFNRAELYRLQGDYDRAIADYTQTITLHPGYAPAYRYLGLAYRVKGDYAKALDNYTTALELRRGPYSFLERGQLYSDMGNFDAAIHDFTDAIQLQYDLTEAYYSRGLAYRWKKDNEKAIADFEKVIELNNDARLRGEAEEQLKALQAR